MANKELRKMNRTELIEIIYALQQNEKTLREENEELRTRAEDKTIRMEQSGSIAEAALSLNHIFEEAETAARQYLDSVKEARGPAEEQAQIILEDAAERAEQIVTDAAEQARELVKAAKIKEEQADELLRQADEERSAMLAETEEECTAMLEEAGQKARDRIRKVNRKINLLLNKYPMLREYLEAESQNSKSGMGGDGT